MPASLRAGLALLVTCLALPASAGPCLSCAPSAPAGWWDDRPLEAGRTADSQPRVDVDGDGVTSRVAIAWARREAGDGDVLVALSDDGGCSWTTTPVSPGPDDDSRPDVGVLLARDLVAVTFVRGLVVMASVSTDGGRTFPAPSMIGMAEAGTRPRLALAPTSGETHVHVAWATRGALHLATNLASGAAAAWTTRAVSDDLAGFGSWSAVDVSADTRSSAPGTQSAITLLAAGVAPPAPGATEIFALRSNDSGATFLGDPATPATLGVPRRVSAPRTSGDPALGCADPRLDASDDGSGEFYTWEAAAYTDLEAGGARADARAEEGTAPSTLADWNDGATDDLALGAPGRAAAVAVIPNPLQRPPSPEAWFFFERAGDVVGARTLLDTSAPGWIAPTCATAQVTGASPARAAGLVQFGSASADEDLSHVVLAWTDTRDGGSAIWWKRTDTSVQPPWWVTAAPGDCATGGGLVVSWDMPPQCDVRAVRIEWATAAGGLDGTSIVPATSPATLVGVPAATTLFVRVVVVDEACNEAVSAEASGTSAPCAPPLPPNPVGPTLRAARRPSPGDVDLRWEPPPVDAAHDAATSYDVHRSVLRPRDGFALAAAAGLPAWTDTGAAAPGRPLLHFYLVVARNAGGTSGDEPLP